MGRCSSMPRARRTAVTQQTVERALGKLLTDENFRDRAALVSLHDDLDKRISRPSLDPDRGEAGKVARP